MLDMSDKKGLSHMAEDLFMNMKLLPYLFFFCKVWVSLGRDKLCMR
jgi:hypothetical protein